MTPGVRKLALTAHVVSSVGWLGAVVVFVALAITGLTSANAQLVRAVYLSMELIGWFVIVPLGVGSLLTGLLPSLGTEWGLFRHYWVLVKFLLTIGATILLVVHMQPTSHVARVASETTLASTDLRGLRIQLVGDASAALVVLLVATILSVYKPWGRTEYGRRELQQRMISLNPNGPTGAWPGRELAGGTAWGRYVVIGIIGLVVTVVIVHLAGGGLHAH